MHPGSSSALRSGAYALGLLLPMLTLLAPAAHAADPAAGGRIFATHCAQCHGASGQGVLPGAPKFNRGERLLQPDIVLLATVKRGKNAMPSFMGVLRDREILDAIAYARTLQK